MSDGNQNQEVATENLRPIEGIAQELEKRGFKPTPTEKGYVAFCPVHKDEKRPNLSINEDEDGVVIM